MRFCAAALSHGDNGKQLGVSEVKRSLTLLCARTACGSLVVHRGHMALLRCLGAADALALGMEACYSRPLVIELDLPVISCVCSIPPFIVECLVPPASVPHLTPSAIPCALSTMEAVMLLACSIRRAPNLARGGGELKPVC